MADVRRTLRGSAVSVMQQRLIGGLERVRTAKMLQASHASALAPLQVSLYILMGGCLAVCQIVCRCSQDTSYK